MTIRQATAPWMQGYNFGVGADLMSGSPMARVVDDTHVGVTDAGGATVDFRVERVQTTADLERALGIDVEASYGSAAFGAGAEARFSFAKRSAIHTSTLFMTVNATVRLQFLSIDAPVLTAGAAALVSRPDRFTDRFGDVFVRGLARGGLFLGVLRIETRSSEDTEKISAELEGSYGLFSASAKTRFEEVQKKFQATVSVQMYHEGGPTDLRIDDPSDPLELLRNVNLFLSAFQNDPGKVAIPYEVTLAPIAIAEGPPPPNAVDIQHAQDVLVFAAKRRSQLLDQLNLLQYISDNPARFDFGNGATTAAVKAALAGTQSDLDLIAACASAAINDPGKALLPADFASARGKAFPAAELPNPMPLSKQTGAPAEVTHSSGIVSRLGPAGLRVGQNINR